RNGCLFDRLLESVPRSKERALLVVSKVFHKDRFRKIWIVRNTRSCLYNSLSPKVHDHLFHSVRDGRLRVNGSKPISAPIVCFDSFFSRQCIVNHNLIVFFGQNPVGYSGGPERRQEWIV